MCTSRGKKVLKYFIKEAQMKACFEDKAEGQVFDVSVCIFEL